jgi:hypothetical protein
MPMGLVPVDERERLRNRVDLIVVTNSRKSEQHCHEFIQPRCVLPEMNHAGMEVGLITLSPSSLPWC